MLDLKSIIKNLNIKQKIIIPAILICSLIIILAFILPFARKWSEQSQQISQKKLKLQKNMAIIDQQPALKDNFMNISKGIQARLPSQRGESTFLTAIGDVAKYTNLHIETMNPRPIKDLEFFRELSVEINMEANLGNVVRFLYQMRKSSVVLTANRLRLEPKSERSALLKGHLVISTIFLKEQI